MATARFRLEPLIAARQLRLDAAMSALRACHAGLAQAEHGREEAEQRRQMAVEARRQQQRLRSAQAMETGAMLSAVLLSQSEQRLGWLDDQIERRVQEVTQAQSAVDAARETLNQALAVYRRAQAKLDALKLQKQAWQRERQQHESRAEEDATEELLVNRYARRLG